MDIVFNAAPNSIACPNCSSAVPEIVATVSAGTGKWERSFHACPECHAHFASSWSNTHEASPQQMSEKIGDELSALLTF